MRSPARWLFLALVGTLQAATIRGVALDNLSGRALARTLVRLEIIQGSIAGNPVVRTDSSGHFALPPVTAGVYLLNASRPGFATLRYGQKAWNAAGTPILVDEGASLFLQLRLRRLGAITGVINDENEIGLPDQDVLAYRATRPPKLVARARADDQGFYRIGKLEPGSYLVRTAARRLEDGSGLLPTFHKEALAVGDSRPVQVYLDEATTEVNVRPIFGSLYRLSGRAYAPFRTPATVALVSDMGSLTIAADSEGRYSFDQLPPGVYELVAYTGQGGPSAQGAYERFSLGGNLEMNLSLTSFPTLDILYMEKGGRKIDPRTISVMARRKDLSGEGTPQRIPSEHAELLPGRWEISIRTPPDLYPASIGARLEQRAERADGWNEILLSRRYMMPVRVMLSSRPAVLRGRVLQGNRETAVGAPVYLEAYDRNTQRRQTDLRATRTNARGEFLFAGLAPGFYRLLSTFEFEDPDEQTMDSASPAIVSLEEGVERQQDLELYIRP